VTRNAVIGKVHRLGLSNRATSAAKGAAKPAAKAPEKPQEKPKATMQPAPSMGSKPPPAPKPADPVAEMQKIKNLPIPPRRPIIKAGQPLPPQPSANEVSAEALANVKEVEKTAKRLQLMELTERTCKWPVGDPATDDFWFCGHPVQQGKPYCEAHVSVAFQPMSSRRDRRSSR